MWKHVGRLVANHLRAFLGSLGLAATAFGGGEYEETMKAQVQVVTSRVVSPAIQDVHSVRYNPLPKPGMPPSLAHRVFR